jgi:hypothetical protein
MTMNEIENIFLKNNNQKNKDQILYKYQME